MKIFRVRTLVLDLIGVDSKHEASAFILTFIGNPNFDNICDAIPLLFRQCTNQFDLVRTDPSWNKEPTDTVQCTLY